ncbi:MAG: hypothetical protein J5590_10175, partial [Clostridia bacterium]|nr:hypothetical protein [Clostridia bacterium]
MKKKFILVAICVAMVMTLMNLSIPVMADQYFSGSGTQADPFLIQTAADLTQLATLTNSSATGTTYAVGKYYKLTADIDMSGVSAYMPISRAIGVGGSHTLPGGTTFKSTFDGDGHVIKNVTMTAQTLAAGGSTYGIIGWLGLDGVIKNLGVENI